MPIITPFKCWRGRSDCMSLASVEGIPDDVSEEQLETLQFEPKSFVCCGCVSVESRTIAQDAYSLCFKNDVCDDRTLNDEQDLSHLLYVISQSLAVIATRKVNSGSIAVIDPETGDVVNVETKQKAF